MNTEILDEYDGLCDKHRRSKACRHLVKCAVTDEERAAAAEALETARAHADGRGVVIALARLSGPCCKSA